MTQFTIVVVCSTEQVNPTALSEFELLLDEFVAKCHFHDTEHTVAVQFKMATQSSVKFVESHSNELTFVCAQSRGIHSISHFDEHWINQMTFQSSDIWHPIEHFERFETYSSYSRYSRDFSMKNRLIVHQRKTESYLRQLSRCISIEKKWINNWIADMRNSSWKQNPFCAHTAKISRTHI